MITFRLLLFVFFGSLSFGFSATSMMAMYLYIHRVTQARKKQQNNDYRFVDVISCKLTLLMSINLRHGILLSALFAFFVPTVLVMFSFYYFISLVSFIYFVSFVHPSLVCSKAKGSCHSI